MTSSFLDAPRSGTPADSPTALMRPDDLVGAIGRFLRRLAASEPVEGAPLLDPSSALAEARARVDAGEVDPSRFDAPYRHLTALRLLDAATALAARLAEAAPAPTVPVHGSLVVSRLQLDGGDVVGWPPAEPAVGDAYVDLAAVAVDLAGLIGPAAVPAVVDAAGIAVPEPLRIEFWVTIRQLR